jgi:outer membrane protein OmpA-like peptidoglycan-associated protein
MVTFSGCATRKYVRNQVEALDPRLTELANAGREATERIDAVDRRAQQGITAAGAADQKATQAQAAAQAAQQAAQAADRKADTANQAVTQTNTRITSIESRISGMGDNYTAGQPVSVTFRVNSSTLSDEARGTLDGVASNVGGMRSGFMIEIQGFTDDSGSEMYNINLSQRRAESVLRYLVSKNVPLYRISIVGLGEANPVAPNNTRQGREQNRRVEVRVLRSTSTTTNNN